MTITLVSLCAAFLACTRGGGDAIRTFATDSEFIFAGTTVLPRSSTIDAEDVADLAIVRVDEIVSGAPVFRNLTGQQVTLRLKSPESAKAGDRRVYFTKGWHYGESIGLVEVGSVAVPPGSGLQTMRSDIERFQQQQSDSDLKQRLTSAELVLIGRVTAVRKSSVPRMITEHDPDWQEADVAIDTVLRGTNAAKSVTILFPGSDDPMWLGAPKLATGMEGIFLLRRFEETRQQLPHLAVTKNTDVYPRAAEARIRMLLEK